MLKWLVSLFRRKNPLSIYPARRRGVLSFIEVPRDEEDRGSGMGRYMAGRGSSESLDYSAVNLGGDFPEGRSENVRRISEGFDLDNAGDPEEVANPYGG